MILKVCEYCASTFIAERVRRRFCSKSCARSGPSCITWQGGIHDHPDYYRWKGMIKRCYNPNDKSYPRYGGRGITVSDEWRQSFWNFANDMGACPEGYSLDRIDNDGPYSVDNCRWADATTQANNKRNTIKVAVAIVDRVQ